MREWLTRLAGLRPGGGEAPHEAITRARQLWDARRYDDLVVACEAGLRRWPRESEFHYLLGSHAYRFGRYLEAAAHFESIPFNAAYPLGLNADLRAALARCKAVPEAAPADPEADLPVDSRPRFSIIVCSIDHGKFSALTAECERQWRDWPYEIVHVGDARSLAEGYNRGLARSTGEICLFVHDDIRFVSDGVPSRITSHLNFCDLLGIAGSDLAAGAAWMFAGWPHLAGQIGMDRAHQAERREMERAELREEGESDEAVGVIAYGLVDGPLTHQIQVLDGVFLAMRREVAEAVKFDAEFFDGWHHYDLDFSFRAFLAGYRVGVANDILVVHNTSANGYLTEEWRKYEARFLEKLGDQLISRGVSRPTSICAIVLNSDAEWRQLSALRLWRAERASAG